MQIAYFVHDLSDPAVARRIRMLQAGGARVTVIGFHRSEAPPSELAGAPTLALGRTFDGRMGQRAWATLRSALAAGRFRSLLAGAEVVMARTLEMLLIASAAQRAGAPGARLIFECLDIHRLMLGDDAKGRALRGLERALLRRCQLLILSSPAFLSAYFAPRQGVGGDLAVETLLVENKLLELDGAPTLPPPPRPGPPWRIAWLGAIRCRRSLDVLIRLAARRPDLVRVDIHGRPAYGEFDDFDRQVAAAPNVAFHGSYTPGDLPRLYGEAHFSWAVDFMEEGLNSAWLLPNRIYEGSRFGVVPIALTGVETGCFIQARGFGLAIEDLGALEATLEAMTADRYAHLRHRQSEVPLNAFVADRSDCVALVRALGGRARGDDAGNGTQPAGPGF